jgi:hypothetical protein
MTDEEVDELLKAVDTSSGEINYTGRLSMSLLLSFGGKRKQSRSLHSLDLVRTILTN